MLIHCFFQANRNHTSKRARLAEWVGDKMNAELKERFIRCKLVLNKNFDFVSGIDEIKKELDSFRELGEKIKIIYSPVLPITP